ncbi:MAG: hypothetical protein AB7U62_04405 [Pseudolabrys sp.]
MSYRRVHFEYDGLPSGPQSEPPGTWWLDDYDYDEDVGYLTAYIPADDDVSRYWPGARVCRVEVVDRLVEPDARLAKYRYALRRAAENLADEELSVWAGADQDRQIAATEIRRLRAGSTER